MKYKRILALALALVTVFALTVSASAAEVTARKATDFSDFDAKAWYAKAVSAAVDNGLLQGKSARILDPADDLTRAEMAAVINRSFGAYKTTDISNYKDVPTNAWYYKDIQKAVWMGTYEGRSTTTMDPESNISRQEIMTVVARALQLDLDRYSATDLSKFPDYKKVSAWALPYVKAMVGAGYIQGRGDGLAPLSNITRAEFAQVFYNIISQYIVKEGSYNGNLKGNLLIRTDDVTLKDAVIEGDLIIGNGAADGTVTLSNVTITGRMVVWGGGIKAGYCNNGTDVEELIVCRVDNPVKVIFDRDSTLKVYSDIDVEITDRAEAYPETEVIFYARPCFSERSTNGAPAPVLPSANLSSSPVYRYFRKHVPHYRVQNATVSFFPATRDNTLASLQSFHMYTSCVFLLAGVHLNKWQYLNTPILANLYNIAKSHFSDKN